MGHDPIDGTVDDARHALDLHVPGELFGDVGAALPNRAKQPAVVMGIEPLQAAELRLSFEDETLVPEDLEPERARHSGGPAADDDDLHDGSSSPR